ncbi:UNVERIFIED_CONTAM: hypothetical protein RMT77_008331 [Armadillidium vulgare]
MVCKNILITGSNRGLGLEFVKQLLNTNSPPVNLIAVCRSPEKAKDLTELQKNFLNLKILKFDLWNEDKYEEFATSVTDIVGSDGLNLLVNNAGIAPKSTKINKVTFEQMKDTLFVNTVAPLMLTKTLIPVLKTASSLFGSSNEMSITRCGVINMSSILGSIKENADGGLYPYRCSKAALNAITKSLSLDLKPYKILVTSFHPGWVRTDMGGPRAPLSPEESIKRILTTLSTLGEEHNGEFLQYDGKLLCW